MTSRRFIAVLIVTAVVFSEGCLKKTVTTQTTAAAVPQADAALIAQGLVNVRSFDPSVRVELRYSTTNNFLGRDVYGDLENCFLQPDTAAMLTNAQAILAAENPGYSLLVYDGARPLHIQRDMYALVRDTPLHIYVADPARGSLHNYGCAVDLTVVDGRGKPLDMGTGFDSFTDAAQPRYEDEMLRKGVLTASQISNRLLLRRVMERAGFQSISSEWWHFQSCGIAEAKEKYRIVP